MMMDYYPRPPDNVKIVQKMTQTLEEDLHKFLTIARLHPVDKFHEYKNLRLEFKKLRLLTAQIQARLLALPEQQKLLGKRVADAKLLSLQTFNKISRYFFDHAPVTITQAIGAQELLHEEKQLLIESVEYFDSILLDPNAGLDDKKAEELDRTRQDTEQLVIKVEELLKHSPKQLEEF
jgi:hypothetical protein